MGQRIDWEADGDTAERVLREAIVETGGLGTYANLSMIMFRRGYTVSSDAVRRRCSRLGLGTQTQRVEYAQGRRHEIQLVKERPDLLEYLDDKKESEIDLEEVFDLLERAQQVNHKASTNQDVLHSGFPEATKPIAVCQISDWHLASYGTDHRYARQFLQELESIPDLFLVIVGDVESMQINLTQGVSACSDNILTPAMQAKLLEALLSRISARTLASTWDNHSIERQERGSGASLSGHIFSERIPYFSGIGHWDLRIGQETYKIAVSHKFRGRSQNNPCYGGMQYLRLQANDREIALCGDSHTPGILRYNEGGLHRMSITSGTLQASGYSKRYYSLVSSKVMPVIQFFPDCHMAIPYWSVQEWLFATGRHDLVRM